MAKIFNVSLENQHVHIYTNPQHTLILNHQDDNSFSFTYDKQMYTIVLQDGIIKLQENAGKFSWIQSSNHTSMIFADAPQTNDVPFRPGKSLNSVEQNSTIISSDVFMQLLTGQSSVAIGAGARAHQSPVAIGAGARARAHPPDP